MKYADVAGPLGSAWSFAKWQGSLADVHNLDVAMAVTTRAISDRGVGLARLDGWCWSRRCAEANLLWRARRNPSTSIPLWS